MLNRIISVILGTVLACVAVYPVYHAPVIRNSSVTGPAAEKRVPGGVKTQGSQPNVATSDHVNRSRLERADSSRLTTMEFATKNPSSVAAASEPTVPPGARTTAVSYALTPFAAMIVAILCVSTAGAIIAYSLVALRDLKKEVC